MQRFFTVSEAERVLPEVERLLRRLIQFKREYETIDGELDGLAQQITLMGGMIAPRERMSELRGRKDASVRGLKATVESIQEIGCELKDIDTGLVDFPTLYRNEEVYLCWKLGESGIGFWHRVQDGYRGRRPIDNDFRANHRGEN